MITKYNARSVSTTENRNAFTSGSGVEKQPKKIGEYYYKSKQYTPEPQRMNLNCKVNDADGKLFTCRHISYQLCQKLLHNSVDKKNKFRIVDVNSEQALKNLVITDSQQTARHIDNDIIHFKKTAPECHVFMGENALQFMQAVLKTLASVSTPPPSSVTSPTSTIKQVFLLESERHSMCFVASRKKENGNFLYSLKFFNPNDTNEMTVIRFVLPLAKMHLDDQHHKLIERFSTLISAGKYANELWIAYRFETNTPIASPTQQEAVQKTIYHRDVPLERKFYRCMGDGNVTELCNLLDAIDEAKQKYPQQDTTSLAQAALWTSALDGTTGIWQAMQNNCPEALKVFLNAKGFKELNPNIQQQIFMTKTGSGVPGLYMAMQNGHSAVLKTLLDSSFFQELSKEQQMQIIGCERFPGGLQGLAAALFFGKMNIFETLFTHWTGFKQMILEEKQEFLSSLSKLIHSNNLVGNSIQKNGCLDKLNKLLDEHNIEVKI